MNVELIPFDNFSFIWNSVRNHTISSFISIQKFLINPKLIPSGPRLLKLSQPHSAALISSIEKCLVKLLISALESILNWRFPTLGRATLWEIKWFLKYVNTTCRTGWTPSTTVLFTIYQEQNINYENYICGLLSFFFVSIYSFRFVSIWIFKLQICFLWALNLQTYGPPTMLTYEYHI